MAFLSELENVDFRARYNANYQFLQPKPAQETEMMAASSRIEATRSVGDSIVAHLSAIQTQQAELLRAVLGVNDRLTALERKVDGKFDELDNKMTALQTKVDVLDGKLEDVKKDTSASFKVLVTVFGGVQIFFGIADKNPIEQARLLGAGLTQLLNFFKP